MPRAQLTWCATFNVTWQIVLALVTAAQASGSIIHPNLLSGLQVTALVLASVNAMFTMFWWGPSAGYRKGLGWSEMCRRVVGESEVSFEKRMSRIIRCYGDLVVNFWIIGSTAFVLIFLIVFYVHQGIQNFPPPLAYDAQALANFYTMQSFYRAQQAISGVTVALAICTFFADMFKRYVLSMNSAVAVQIPDGTTATGSETMTTASSAGNMLLGAINPK